MLYELKRIKQTRQKLGLTQTQLATLAQVSQSLITKIERGTIEPSYTIAKRIFFSLEKQLADKQKEIIAKDVYTKNIVMLKSTDSLNAAIKLMKKYAISQIPITKNQIIIGSISEETIIKKYDQIKDKNMKVETIMDEPLPTLPENASFILIRDILKIYPAVILTKNGIPSGIITKADLLKKL